MKGRAGTRCRTGPCNYRLTPFDAVNTIDGGRGMCHGIGLFDCQLTCSGEVDISDRDEVALERALSRLRFPKTAAWSCLLEAGGAGHTSIGPTNQQRTRSP